MDNKCRDCGICCLNTNMILSEQDISLILKNYASNDLRRQDFIFRNKKGHFQLKCIENHCVFFDTITKTCKIYYARPQGCRFYPLIYDYEKRKCIFDKDCPRTHLFYQKIDEPERACEKIKKFIKKQLLINI